MIDEKKEEGGGTEAEDAVYSLLSCFKNIYNYEKTWPHREKIIAKGISDKRLLSKMYKCTWNLTIR